MRRLAAASPKRPTSPPTAAMSLPTRDVTPETLEEAYVAFIFYCNPAVPRHYDSTPLREAFRATPKHLGKVFDVWTIFQLVRRFYAKDIKTWTELIITLGVEPPDLAKEESSQKVTQYGVRLKKWMNSLRVKSFFEYLMGTPNDYWTNIPSTIGGEPRDGVAVEDDMALRALLPHLRPRRGRKRPSERELDTPVSARPRLSPASGMEPTSGTLTPWPRSEENDMGPDQVHSAHPATTGPSEEARGAYAHWPASAATPTARHGFWDETSTPTSGPRQRRGPKNVSSAWRLGPEDNGKARGRPPVNRTPVEDSPFAYRSWQPPPAHMAADAQPHTPPVMGRDIAPGPATDHPGAAQVPLSDRACSESQRPQRPSISLQVPERSGGNVRLATPPPPPLAPHPPGVVVSEHPEMRRTAVHEPVGERAYDMGHGTAQANGHVPVPNRSSGWRDYAKQATDQYESADDLGSSGLPVGSTVEHYFFEKTEERTNVDTLINFFMRTTQDGQWFDCDGHPTEAASMDESAAIVNAFLQGMFKTATSSQAFLINLGALAGARTLMTTQPKYYRLPDGDGCHNYRFEWEYSFAHVKGHFSMTQVVPWDMWKKPPPPPPPLPQGPPPGLKVSASDPGGRGDGGPGLSAEEWKKKYEVLLGEIGRGRRSWRF
ncbi:ARS-binding protein-like protein [Emericellopsis cladophorae]|uniref:ARS-binding protein-like protein n=1 Tax=Emericellopsis cladophorae TaxID=2686198 RepID=A0A9P9XVW2_9HYPO|nr:ARS-binding protein-like protein [Emericellopsis cladophorae]KAI6778797.1 ARS-binding protein-like protein [Emericellopsis cladophorae]